jgi:hypothetical protein
MQPITVSAGRMPTGSVLTQHPAQIASAPNSKTPRLWLKLKPIQARHMSVPPTRQSDGRIGHHLWMLLPGGSKRA